MTNIFVQNLCFYRARFSIQSLFETTPCPLKAPARKSYWRFSIRQQPRIYRGPAVDGPAVDVLKSKLEDLPHLLRA